MVSSVLTLLIAFACLSPLLVDGKVVFYDNFSGAWSVNTTKSNYVYYARKPIVANDGKIYVNSGKTLTQDVRPYKLTVPYGSSGTSDRFKSIVLQKTKWPVSKTQVLTCELKTWSQQTNTAKHPFGSAVTDANNDPRLASCGLYVGDSDTYTLAHFVQSNKQNFPYHARQSSGQNKTGGGLGYYHAFNSFKTGVSTRASSTTYSTLTVQYDRGAGTLKWLADGKLVNTVTKIGIPPSTMINVLDTGGTTTKAVDVASFQCGFGCWDFLDFADPLNAKNTKGLVKLSNTTGFYAYPTSWVSASTTASRLFGQGELANHAYLKIDISPKSRLLREGKIEE